MFELRERFDGDWNHPLRCAAMAVDVRYRGFAFQKMSVSTHEEFVRTQFQSIFRLMEPRSFQYGPFVLLFVSGRVSARTTKEDC